jgi:hypothetical protein
MITYVQGMTDRGVMLCASRTAVIWHHFHDRGANECVHVSHLPRKDLQQSAYIFDSSTTGVYENILD